MHYIVISRGNRHFEVIDEQNNSLGTLDYKPWSPNKAQITTINNIIYEIAPEGFWQTKIAVTRNDIPVAEIKPNWGTGLYLLFAAHAQPYTFKKKSLWGSDYLLCDESGNEIAMVQSEFKWSNWSFQHEIDVRSNILDKETNVMLPLLIAYSVRYIRMRHAAVS